MNLASLSSGSGVLDNEKIDKNYKRDMLFCIFLLVMPVFVIQFYGDFNLYTTVRSDDGEYYANIYKHLPTSPISIVQILGGNKYFTVLYNKKGEELWRVSYFDYIGEESLFDMMAFPDESSNTFFCPTNHGLDGYNFSKTIRNHKLQ